MDVPLEGMNSKKKVSTRANDSQLAKSKKPIQDVVDFLEKHESARIVLIIDTHCLDCGGFVWTGDSPQTFQGCTVGEVCPFGTL